MATLTQTISPQQSVLNAHQKLYSTVASVALTDEQTDSSSISTESKSLPEIPLPPPSKAPTEVLSIDKDTPDHHVARDPRLIRLTGVHPFNVEPPLTTLFNEGTKDIDDLNGMKTQSSAGFLTSPELFYVRNHGPVPQVHDEDIPKWEISIEG